MADILPPRAFFKLVNLGCNWDRVSLAKVEVVADLKKAIKNEAPVSLNSCDASQLIIKATKNIDDINLAKELDPRKSLASILEDFGVMLPEDITLIQVQKTFAKNIMLFVYTPIVAPQVTFEDAMTAILSEFEKFETPKEKVYRSMALKDREFKQAIEVIETNLENRLRDMTSRGMIKNVPHSKSNYRILLCGGAPGLGKTRYGIELSNYLATEWQPPEHFQIEKNNFVHVLLDFSSGTKITDEDVRSSADIILGLRIAFNYFVEGRYGTDFIAFRERARQYGNIFKLGSVLSSIRQDQEIPNNQLLFLFVQIDDFQKILKPNINITASNNKDKNWFKDMIYTLGHFMVSFPGVYVQTLLSGTAAHDAIEEIEPTMYSCQSIELPLLSLKSRIELMREFTNIEKFQDYIWTSKLWIHQLLLDTGGLPRALECLFTAFFGQDYKDISGFFEHIDTINSKEIFDKTIKSLDNRYYIHNFAATHKGLALELFYRNVMAIKSNVDDDLNNGESTVKLRDLERDRHIILKKLDTYGSVQVEIPYFFLHLYNSALHLFSRQLSDVTSPNIITYWQEFEILVADYVALRIKLLANFKRTLILEDIFFGAYCKDSNLLDLKLKLKPSAVCTLKHQFPCVDLTLKDGNTVDWESGCVMINAHSASYADVFLCDKASAIIIAIQCRKRKGPLTMKAIEDEHKKNSVDAVENLMAKCMANKNSHVLKGLYESLRNYRVITVFITTQHFRNDAELPSDCLLIERNNFNLFFGPAFSSRAKLVSTKDSNPNFFSEVELVSRFDGIKGETATDIVNKRSYMEYNEFNLFEEFPILKENEEVRNGLSFYPSQPYVDEFEFFHKTTKKRHIVGQERMVI